MVRKSLFFRFLALIFFIGLYFQAVIPFREFSMDVLKSNMSENKSAEVKVFEEGARGITVYKIGNVNKYKARVPFGMNFFIGIIGLVLISSSRKFYLIEIGVQLLFGAIIFSAFLYGVKGNTFLLRISDMASIYFLPLSSLFMVVLAFIEKKALKERELYDS
ncbi:MAG: hypothetical protein ABJH08_09020 [Balneola sp.]